MTSKPSKSRSARRPARQVRKPSKPAKAAKPDALEVAMAASARALGLTIDKAWMAAVRGHLQVTLRHGALVAAFALPDEAEPAPVFKA
jgi:1-carboxybiuret hydrolase subunit AtzG-like